MSSRAVVLLVEDDEVVARSIDRRFHALTKSNVETCLARGVQAALDRLEPEARWVGALVDYWLGDGDGLEVVRAFRQREPVAPAMIMTAADIDGDLSTRASVFGATTAEKRRSGWLEAFVQQVETFLVSDPRAGARAAILARARRLTPREGAVTRLRLCGTSRAETAAALGIAERTVEKLSGKALDKFGMGSYCELAFELVRLTGGEEWFAEQPDGRRSGGAGRGR